MSVRPEIELASDYPRSRRPNIVGSPLVGPSLKYCRFFNWQRARAVQPIGEPRGFDLLSKKRPGVTAEIHYAEFGTVSTHPTCVVPRTYDYVILMCSFVCLWSLIYCHGSIEIFWVPPASDV